NHGVQITCARYAVLVLLPRRKASGTDRRLQAQGLPPTENRGRHLTFTRTGVHGLRWAPRSSKPLVGILGDVDGRIVPVAPPPIPPRRHRPEPGNLRTVVEDSDQLIKSQAIAFRIQVVAQNN